MYRLIKANGLLLSIRQEAPTGIVAFVIAELFYKFHSFALECLAFLVTWFLFSYLAGLVNKVMKYKNKEVSHE